MSVRSVVGTGAIVVSFGLASSCKGPVTSPEELAKMAENARAAMSAAPFVPAEPSSQAHAPPPLTPQAFKATVPTAVCATANSADCALDVVAGAPATDVVTVKQDSSPTFVGWAAEADRAPPVVLVELVGPKKKKYFAPASRITKRPDVAAAHNAPGLVDAGYDLIGVLQDVEPATYAVHVVQVTAAGEALECDTRRQLKVE
jgi:hypothetical protein